MDNLMQRMKLLSKATEAFAIEEILTGTFDLAGGDTKLKQKLIDKAIIFFESAKYGLLLVQGRHKDVKKPDIGTIEILDNSGIALRYFKILDPKLYDPYLEVLKNIREGLPSNNIYRNLLLKFYEYIDNQAITKCRNLAHFAEGGGPGDFDFL